MTRSPTPCRASRFKLPMPALHLHFMNKINDQLQRVHAWAAGDFRCCCAAKASAFEIVTCACTFTLKAAPAAAAANDTLSLMNRAMPSPGQHACTDP